MANKSKLERRFGKYAIHNITLYLIVGYIIGYIAYYMSRAGAIDFYSYLTFDPYQILHGQVWRLITWIITIPEQFGIFTIIMLFFYYFAGNAVESAWGAFKYNSYLLLGFIFTMVGAFILYFILGAIDPGLTSAINIGKYIGNFVSTYYINMSILLAFAATFPEQEVLLYMIIPIKIKWLGLIYGAFILIQVGGSEWPVRMMIIASLLNFIIFFFSNRNIKKYSPKQMKRKREYNKKVHQSKQSRYENGVRHKCSVCGRTDVDFPDLSYRYCSKCSGNKEYCQDHLFTHTHN